MLRDQKCDRVGLGRYRVRRSIKMETATYSKEIECNNPAWAFRRLDEWEHQLMVQDQPKQKAVAA